MDAFLILVVDTDRKGGPGIKCLRSQMFCSGELLAVTSPVDAAGGNGGDDWSVPKSIA